MHYIAVVLSRHLRNIRPARNEGICLSCVPNLSDCLQTLVDYGQFRSLTHLLIDMSDAESLNPCFCRLGKLQHLRIVNMSNLTELPDEIGNLSNLTHLIIESCGLTCLPETLARLKRLECLRIENCSSFTSLPANIYHLRRLATLHVCFTSLRAIPTNLYRLPKLTKLSVSSLNLKVLPDTFTRFQALTGLNISFSSWKGTLGLDFSPMLTLQTFLCEGCLDLEELPAGLFGLPRLRVLNASNNPQLKTLIPEGTPHKWRESQLTDIVLSASPSLTSLPAVIFQLPELRRLKVSTAALRDPLPPGPWMCTKLCTFDFPSTITILPKHVQNLWELTYHSSNPVLKDLAAKNRRFLRNRHKVLILMLWNARIPSEKQRLPWEILYLLVRDFVRC